MSKNKINWYTVCLWAGIITLVVSSAISFKYRGVPFNSYETKEEFIYYGGQAVGYLFLYLWMLKRSLNALEYIGSLLLLDLAFIEGFDTFVSNPFIHNWSKTISVVIAILFSAYKLFMYFKKKK